MFSSATIVLGVALQVTPNRVPVVVSSLWDRNISLFAVTAVVFTVQVLTALVAQENEPANAAPQAATDGLAALPTAEQLALVVRCPPVKIMFPVPPLWSVTLTGAVNVTLPEAAWNVDPAGRDKTDAVLSSSVPLPAAEKVLLPLTDPKIFSEPPTPVDPRFRSPVPSVVNPPTTLVSLPPAPSTTEFAVSAPPVFVTVPVPLPSGPVHVFVVRQRYKPALTPPVLTYTSTGPALQVAGGAAVPEKILRAVFEPNCPNADDNKQTSKQVIVTILGIMDFHIEDCVVSIGGEKDFSQMHRVGVCLVHVHVPRQKFLSLKRSVRLDSLIPDIALHAGILIRKLDREIGHSTLESEAMTSA